MYLVMILFEIFQSLLSWWEAVTDSLIHFHVIKLIFGAN